MGLDRRLIELTRGSRRWIAATVALGWLIVALNVAQTVLVGHAISFGFAQDKGGALVGQSGLGWLFVALGIGIHNFPEGMASFVGALESRELGIAIAFAVAVHNIPEGVAVSAPIYAATGSRGKAFLWSFLSGVAELIGAGLAALVLMPFLSEAVLGVVLAAVAGIMVIISIDELVPVSRSFGEERLSIVGVVVGMAVMVLSLWMLK